MPAACGLVWQGETLEQQFGEKEVCFRTLDLYTSAVLESALSPVIRCAQARVPRTPWTPCPRRAPARAAPPLRIYDAGTGSKVL